jgi:hypothetical protein
MSICCCQQSFGDYINENQPVYKGRDRNGHDVRVKLEQWDSNAKRGVGEISDFEPVKISSLEDRDIISAEVKNKKCYMVLHNRTITFHEGDNSIIYRVIASRDFKELEIESPTLKYYLGTLKLVQNPASRETI